MGDFSASDSSWNKILIAKSNEEWISKAKHQLHSEAPKDLIMNVNYCKPEREIKQETGDDEEPTYLDADDQSDDNAIVTDLLIEKPQRLHNKRNLICDPHDSNPPESATTRKQRKNSVSKSKSETPEERAERLAKMSAYASRRLANETPEQRSLRLRRMSEYAAKRLSRESPEERARRLSRMSAYAAQRLANETPEQRSARLSRMSAYAAKRQAMRKVESVNLEIYKDSTPFIHDQS